MKEGKRVEGKEIAMNGEYRCVEKN